MNKITTRGGSFVVCAIEIPKLMTEKNSIYDQIMQIINNSVVEIFFLHAPGGTGETFLIRLILLEIRSHNDIALALATCVIAGTLLSGGTTAHFALKWPLSMQFNETPTDNSSKASGMAKYRKNPQAL